jgi:hypothetical protein
MSDNHALEQAKAQASSIIDMVAALNVDYDRLECLWDELEEAAESQSEGVTVPYWIEDQANDNQSVFHNASVEYLALKDAANGNNNEEHAREAIQNDALSVEVRKDWYAPGHEDDKPSEFQILLCTGGPAVRIMGELDDNGEPCRAWIEYQDWGTPWMHAVSVIDNDTLLTYCQQFYFGE